MEVPPAVAAENPRVVLFIVVKLLVFVVLLPVRAVLVAALAMVDGSHVQLGKSITHV